MSGRIVLVFPPIDHAKEPHLLPLSTLSVAAEERHLGLYDTEFENPEKFGDRYLLGKPGTIPSACLPEGPR